MRAQELFENEAISNLRPAIIQAAQEVYDAWQVDDDGYDEEVGVGGICHLIADRIVDILYDHDIEATTINSQIGENHVWVVAKMDDGVWEVDIPPYNYETGGGYNWKKIPDIEFIVDNVVVNRLSANPEDFEQYLEEY